VAAPEDLAYSRWLSITEGRRSASLWMYKELDFMDKASICDIWAGSGKPVSSAIVTNRVSGVTSSFK
jgi:hypothetical protein